VCCCPKYLESRDNGDNNGYLEDKSEAGGKCSSPLSAFRLQQSSPAMHPHLHTKSVLTPYPLPSLLTFRHLLPRPLYTIQLTLLRHRDNTVLCDEVMKALDECHARGFLYAAVGNCNDAKTAVNRCLRAARLERTALHREEAKKDRERIKSVWAEVDEKS
jgi:COX assembly protein 2